MRLKALPTSFDAAVYVLNTVDSRYIKVQGLSEILRDIRTATYQFCIIEEKNKSNNHISHMNM